MTFLAITNTGRSIVALHCTTGINPNGTVGGFPAKAMHFPHQNALAVFNGTTLLGWLANLAIARFASFDEMRTGLASALRDAFAKIGDDESLAGTVAICGWSNEPRAFLITTSSRLPLAAWRTHDIVPGARFISPSSPEIDSEFGCDVELTDANAIALAERCRALKAPGLDGTLRHIVGGSIVRTEITEHEITTRVLHRWPDKIGDMLDAKVAA
jgi:hypothetical protein